MADTIVMVAPILGAQVDPFWPTGVRPSTWRDGDAPFVHALLVSAYQDGGGTVAPYRKWAPWFTGDAEFDPTTCFIARHTDGALTGVCLCWSSGFVKDLCVAPAARRRGVGEALMRTAFMTFAERGRTELRLKVEADNAKAIPLYERLGFRPVVDYQVVH
jgi:ribosomal protein S18 acetylase RimI-like enzyme